jgi:hypothetical protein
MNAGNSELSIGLLTTLPSGTYCDVISGDFVNGVCTGQTIKVDNVGRATFRIHSRQPEPMIAIHIGKTYMHNWEKHTEYTHVLDIPYITRKLVS